MTNISLTQKEEQVIFNYFNLTGCQFNAFRYEVGVKKPVITNAPHIKR